MIISDHAREEMEQAGITADEVRQCLEHGTAIINDFVRGEPRYGKQLDAKEKTIVVIYTLRDNEERVITAYPLQRKKWLR